MKQILRLIKIYIIIMRNSLDKDLFNFRYLWLMKFFIIFFPNLWFRSSSLSRGERKTEVERTLRCAQVEASKETHGHITTIYTVQM